MGAPSVAHEQRVAELGTLAALAGFTSMTTMPWRIRPDVVRTCPATAALFLGDAKETERPGNAATYGRLRWYALAAAATSRPGRRITVALAVPGERQTRPFERLLARAMLAGLWPGIPTTTWIGDTAVIAVNAIVP